MAILKKIKGSTLMETLVSSVLIVVVFMIASMVLNNLFSGAIKNNTHVIETKLDELHYLFLKDAITLPYSESFEKWSISVQNITHQGKKIVEIEAFNGDNKKRVVKLINEN